MYHLLHHQECLQRLHLDQIYQWCWLWNIQKAAGSWLIQNHSDAAWIIHLGPFRCCLDDSFRNIQLLLEIGLLFLNKELILHTRGWQIVVPWKIVKVQCTAGPRWCSCINLFLVLDQRRYALLLSLTLPCGGLKPTSFLLVELVCPWEYVRHGPRWCSFR